VTFPIQARLYFKVSNFSEVLSRHRLKYTTASVNMRPPNWSGWSPAC